MRALDRVVAILEAVATHRNPPTPTVVAARIDLSLSTVSRLMRQMCDLGLLDRDASGAYALGVRLLRISQAALEPSDLVEVALPEMQHLRELTGETVTLFVRRGNSRICLAQAQSEQAVRRVVPVGFTAPLHAGATGEALLAGIAPVEREQYVAALPLPEAERHALRERLTTISEHGFAMSSEAWLPEVAAIAAGVFESSTIVASLSVAGPSYRFTEERMRGFVDELLATAGRISSRIAPMHPVTDALRVGVGSTSS